MSVRCEAFIGYTVTLKTNLKSDDWELIEEFEEKHNEYDFYNYREREGKVLLVVDGMNGLYARFVYVDEHIEECWIDGKDYFPLRSQSVPNDIYEKINKAYRDMYGKDLDKGLIEYALWFRFV